MISLWTNPTGVLTLPDTDTETDKKMAGVGSCGVETDDNTDSHWILCTCYPYLSPTRVSLSGNVNAP